LIRTFVNKKASIVIIFFLSRHLYSVLLERERERKRERERDHMINLYNNHNYCYNK